MAKHRSPNPERKPAPHRPADTRSDGITPRTALGLERIAFFSDAVIAIAITLLALEIRLPEETMVPSELPSALLGLMPRFLSFFISFFVIGLFWMSHHRIFEYLHSYDSNLVLINLIFLFLVAIVPFPTAVLGRFPAQLFSVLLYAASVIALALVRIWFWWYVYYRARLVRPETHPKAGRYEMLRPLWTMIIFAVSIPIALWDPGWAMNFWILLFPISLLTRTRY